MEARDDRITGITSDRQFLGIVGKLLPGWFPRLPDQSQYNRRLRGLTATMVWVQQQIAQLLASGSLRVADSTLIGVANYAGCARRSEFAGSAAHGYCAAKSQYVWGVRLVLLTDPAGLPTGHTLVAANEKEYESVRELTTSQAGCTLIADKGYWGRAYAETPALQDVTIHTPDRARTSDNLAREKRPAAFRLVIDRRSRTSNARCGSSSTSRKPPPDSSNGTHNACSRSPSACSSTPSADAPPRALVAYDGR